MRRFLLAPLVVLLVVVAGLTTAQAAGLNVVSGKVKAFTQTRCTNATVKVAPTGLVTGTGRATGVTATGATDAACVGQPAAVTVYRRTTGATITSFTGTVAANGSVSATVAAYAATSDLAAFVTVNGWAVPAAWVPPISCVSVNDPTRFCDVVWTVTTGNQFYPYYVVDYTVSTPSGADTLQWRITFNLDELSTWLPARIRRYDTQITIPGTCVAVPVLQLQSGTTTATTVGVGNTYVGSVQMDQQQLLNIYDKYPLC